MKKLNFDFFKKIPDKIKNLYEKNKKVFFIGVVLVIVAIVLVCSIISSALKPKPNSSAVKSEVSITEYATGLEKKITEMLLQMKEITSASTFVMVEATTKVEYLTEVQENITTNENGVTTSSKSTTVVFEKNGSISTPVVVTTIMPKVTGVLVVINKISPTLKLNIIRAVASVLNVDELCINILQESQ